MTGLRLDEVSVRYGNTVAVDRVSLDAPESGVLALLGPSGCGKSTLLRAVAGLEPLAAGRVSFDGDDLEGVPTFRRRFGLMFQDGVLFPHRSVAGNVAYGLQVAGMDTAAQRRRVAELLELVGLAGFGDRAVGTLSGGQAQRVALARALAPAPRLLLLDEPLAALDAGLRGQLLIDLRHIVDTTGTPTVFVTHDQDEAYELADQVALMRAGRVVQRGRPRDVWSAPVDEWSAGFLGYRVVVDPARLPALGDLADAGGGMVALRAAALVVDAVGTIDGSVHAVRPGPDGAELTVDVDGELLPAVAGPGRSVTPGERVRLRLRPEAVARVRPADPG